MTTNENDPSAAEVAVESASSALNINQIEPSLNPIQKFWRLISNGLRAVFGQWDYDAPAWIQNLLIIARGKPKHTGLLIAVLFGIVAFAWWWAHRPKVEDPGLSVFTVTTPKLTDYAYSPPTIHNLEVEFDRSVAPLKAIDKAAQGITMQPALAGTWTWLSDKNLSFKPLGDWPIGTEYKINFDKKISFAPKIKLAEYQFEFQTSAFTIGVNSSEFYQDPIDPTLKKAVYQLRASHPIDAGTFEQRVKLSMKDNAERELPAPKFVATYDEKRLEITLQSSSLQLPENGGVVNLQVEKGSQALMGGNGTAENTSAQVNLPARFSLAVNSASSIIVDNADGTPEQVLIVELNQDVRESDVNKSMEAFLLPRLHPDKKRNQVLEDGKFAPFPWNLSEVSDQTLTQSSKLSLTLIEGERDVNAVHSFRFEAEPSRKIYLRLKKGLNSFGGFVMGKDFVSSIAVPDYPKLVKFVGEGALLSLKGEQRVTLAVRNVREVEFTVARIALKELHHLVTFNQQGMKSVDLSPLTADDLSERFRRRIKIPELKPGEVHYEGIDLSRHWTDSTKGVFLISVAEVMPGSEIDEENSSPEQFGNNYNEYDEGDYYEGESEPVVDKRMVVLTDLGLIAKTAVDQSRDVFVQQLQSGQASSNANISVIARNGSTLLTRQTDSEGRASLPSLKGFVHEKKPIMLMAENGGDVTFLPLNDGERQLDLSRFDIGGEVNPESGGVLTAHLFSDRGIYRPGETFHIGMLVRAADWRGLQAGLPLRATILDARGNEARSQKMALDANGFIELDYALSEVAPTGIWTIELARVFEQDGVEQRRETLGQVNIRVKEFLPDRMKLKAELSSSVPQGWVKPDGLKVNLLAENLIGTAAQDRRATGKVFLTPSVPSFAKYPGYVFFDQRKNNDMQEQALGEQKTDATGRTSFDLNLQNISAPTYTLNLIAEVFEADGGRSVTSNVTSLVSKNDFLIGLKSVDSLSYVKRNAKRVIQVLALSANGTPTTAENLSAVVIERRYVSVLTKQDSGLYKYQSVLKEIPISANAIKLSNGAANAELLTNNPGSFVFFVRDRDGNTLNSINFEVAGDGNVARSLDRNAELSLSLNNTEYKGGDEIEISVRAPYTGAGLITIERDRVYASQWFKADTLASVQRIRVPADLAGNAYVNVQFLRDPQSAEVFMSPLSYGVAPFQVNRSAHKQLLSLSAPTKIKPGTELPITLKTDGAAKVVVFAVDEGILQVANYKLADPLDTFLAKKSLQVDTAQILDLLLPEFTQLLNAAAPGGDSEAALSRNLNPFKRKADKPAVYWSGLMEVNGEQTFRYLTPDSFNGKMRLMAVAVAGERIGIANGNALVRGDFVLSPSLPTAIAPGDEFVANVGVAFPPPDGNEKLSAANLQISASVGAGLKLIDSKPQLLNLQPGNESVLSFRVRAEQKLGPQAITFKALSGAKSALRTVELSVRPITPYQASIRTGRMKSSTQAFDQLRNLWPDLAKRELAVAKTPLVLARGLDAYLGDFPHYCSEQLISKSFPALVAREHPELFRTSPKDADLRGLFEQLSARQNSAGGIGLWVATPEAEPFVSAYAGLFFIEAIERGVDVPSDLVQNNAQYLASLASEGKTNSLDDLRVRALATYVLTRRGQVTSGYLANIEQALETNFASKWKSDSTAVLIAATYAQMKQDKAAQQRISEIVKHLKTPFSIKNWWTGYYDDPAIQDAMSLYLIARHFPLIMKALPPSAQERLVGPSENDLNNTLSSSLSVLALAQVAKTNSSPELLSAIKLNTRDARGVETPFGVVQGWWKIGKFGADARMAQIANVGEGGTWYALTDTGFDRAPLAREITQGIEIVREYQVAGKVVNSIKHGDEIDVVLRLRSSDNVSHYNMAIIELLPGGFELVEQSTAAASTGEGAPIANFDVRSRVATAGSDLALDYIEMREDRLVLYAPVSAEAKTFRYRLKATAVGKFSIPPANATDMYDRRVQYVGAAGSSIEVVK